MTGASCGVLHESDKIQELAIMSSGSTYGKHCNILKIYEAARNGRFSIIKWINFQKARTARTFHVKSLVALHWRPSSSCIQAFLLSSSDEVQ